MYGITGRLQPLLVILDPVDSSLAKTRLDCRPQEELAAGAVEHLIPESVTVADGILGYQKALTPFHAGIVGNNHPGNEAGMAYSLAG